MSPHLFLQSLLDRPLLNLSHFSRKPGNTESPHTVAPPLLDNTNCSKEVMALDVNIAAGSTPVQTPNCAPSVSTQEHTVETTLQQEFKYCCSIGTNGITFVRTQAFISYL